MANSSTNQGRGLASNNMSESKKQEIRSKGGQSQGKENNPGNFANDPQKAKQAGQKSSRS